MVLKHLIKVNEQANLLDIGGMCGAIHLNIAFENHISYLVGEVYETLPNSSKKKIRDSFENIKAEFRLGDPDTNSTPICIELPGVPDNSDGSIRGGMVFVTR
jgi:hypothetical protein